MTVKEQALAQRINLVVGQKLEIACRIYGITPEDTLSGKKHINKLDNNGTTSYIYAEEKIPLVVVTYSDTEIHIRRIRRLEYWKHRLSNLLRLWG